jgi:membrane protease YdiL (CAAX protease family)
MKRLVIPVLVAAVLWFILFSPWTSRWLNFWYAMSGSAVVLVTMSVWLSDGFKKQFLFSAKEVIVGIVSATVLWGLFYLGDFFSSLLFDFAEPQVSRIYQMKEGENPLILGLLLFFLIGPAEEIFWRGCLQRSLAGRYGDRAALIVTASAYTLVHVWSFNFMLVMAAMVCGVFWGLLYRYGKNMVALIVSHAVWDVSVFILFPI